MHWSKNPKIRKEVLKKLSLARKGKKHTDECKKRMSKNKIGVNVGKDHYNWKGGLSKNKYPIEFNRSLKMKIRERDNFTCQLCGKTEEEELKELLKKKKNPVVYWGTSVTGKPSIAYFFLY